MFGNKKIRKTPKFIEQNTAKITHKKKLKHITLNETIK